MEKKRYITPCVCETELCEQSMLCLSGDSADINHEYDGKRFRLFYGKLARVKHFNGLNVLFALKTV